jgi:hypothetical protein
MLVAINFVWIGSLDFVVTSWLNSCSSRHVVLMVHNSALVIYHVAFGQVLLIVKSYRRSVHFNWDLVWLERRRQLFSFIFVSAKVVLSRIQDLLRLDLFLQAQELGLVRINQSFYRWLVFWLVFWLILSQKRRDVFKDLTKIFILLFNWITFLKNHYIFRLTSSWVLRKSIATFKRISLLLISYILMLNSSYFRANLVFLYDQRASCESIISLQLLIFDTLDFKIQIRFFLVLSTCNKVALQGVPLIK